tara:strand:+ start:49 stop:363 length:315 start_codon:yes stop_codon:yes gene_type:complete
MSKLERTVKDLVIFYVKENYNNYLKENKIEKIDKDKIKSVISELYYPKKDHLKLFVKESMKELWKEEYPGDLVIDNIFFSIYQDDKFNINRICVEIELHQENNM